MSMFPLLCRQVVCALALATVLGAGTSHLSAAPDQYEPDNQLASAKTIAANTSQTRSISPVGDVDFVKIVLNAPAHVIISTSGPSTTADTYLLLNDPDLNVIAFNDNDGASLYSLVEADVEAGTYYIEVLENGADQEIASYNLLYTISVPDTQPPLVQSITRLTPNPTNGMQVAYRVEFTEGVTGVGTGDFSITRTGTVAGTSIASVSADNGSDLRTVIVNTGTGNGTLRLNVVDNNSIRDPADNRLGGPNLGDGNFNSGQVYTIDKVRPTATFSAASNVVHGPFLVTVTWNEPVTGFSLSDLSGSNGIPSALQVLSTSQYRFTVTPINPGTVSGFIKASSVLDAAGNSNLQSATASVTYTP